LFVLSFGIGPAYCQATTKSRFEDILKSFSAASGDSCEGAGDFTGQERQLFDTADELVVQH